MDSLVSAIITTCRRSPAYVARALESVMAQTYPRIQIIVVDDSPADYPEKEDVRRIVRDLCPRALLLSTGENRGAPAARNMGIRAAEGEFIAFLDDDDEWLPEKITDQMAGFTNDHIALVYGDCIVSDDIRHIRYPCKKKCYSGTVYEPLLRSNFIFSTSIPLMRKTCLEAVGGFDEAMPSAQDYDLYLRFAQRYEIGYVPKTCVIYHIHDAARISTNLHGKILGQERLISKYSADLERFPRAWAAKCWLLVPYYRRTGNTWKALKTWFSAFRKVPFDFHANVKFFFLALFTPDFPLYRCYHHLKMTAKKKLLK